jgi:hypothetical protein
VNQDHSSSSDHELRLLEVTARLEREQVDYAHQLARDLWLLRLTSLTVALILLSSLFVVFLPETPSSVRGFARSVFMSVAAGTLSYALTPSRQQKEEQRNARVTRSS